MFLMLLIFGGLAYTSSAIPKTDSSGVQIQPDDLKTALRQMLSEDPSLVESLLREILRESHQDTNKAAEDQSQEILGLKEEVRGLTGTVTQQQRRIDELENIIREKHERPTHKSFEDIFKSDPYSTAHADFNVDSSSNLHTSNNRQGPNHVTRYGAVTQSKRLVLGENTNVAFCAYLDHVLDGLNPGEVIIYNQVLLNEGNGFNTATGTFTVPVSGVYMFTFFFDVFRNRAELRLVVDSVNQVGSEAGHNNDTDLFDTVGGNTAIIRVSQGQSVWVETVIGSTHSLDSYEDYRKTTFSGALLFEM